MIGYEVFKDRPVPQPGEVVRVHRNLNRRDGIWWAVSVRGQVRGYAREVTLHDARPIVNHRAQARIAEGAAREVHAWVEGTLAAEVIDERPGDFDWRPVTYHPHEAPYFYDKLTYAEWLGVMDTAIFNQRGTFI